MSHLRLRGGLQRHTQTPGFTESIKYGGKVTRRTWYKHTAAVRRRRLADNSCLRVCIIIAQLGREVKVSGWRLTEGRCREEDGWVKVSDTSSSWKRRPRSLGSEWPRRRKHCVGNSGGGGRSRGSAPLFLVAERRKPGLRNVKHKVSNKSMRETIHGGLSV